MQLKWFVTAGLLVAETFTVTLLTNGAVAAVLFDVSLLFLYAAIGTAILKHRLYDIDFLINKAVVYGLLAAFITVVYVAFVVVVGAFVGATQFLSLVATAVVAIAFQPAREKAKRAANRVVYGKRATPYEVLSGFSAHVSGDVRRRALLPRMARLLAEGTGADRRHRLAPGRRGDASGRGRGRDASGAASADRVRGRRAPTFPDADAAVAVRHGSELLGALTVTKPPNDPLVPEEDKLLADLAAQAGLVLANSG